MQLVTIFCKNGIFSLFVKRVYHLTIIHESFHCVSDVAYLTNRLNNLWGLPTVKINRKCHTIFSVVNFECPVCCCSVALCGCWFSWRFSDYCTTVRKVVCSDFPFVYKADGGSFLSHVISGDETWIHQCQKLSEMRLLKFYYFSADTCTCFVWYPHPSSGAHSNCNYNIWHWSNRICYRLLTWRSQKFWLLHVSGQ